MKAYYLLSVVALSSFIVTSCETAPVSHNKLTIVLSDSLETEDLDGERHLPEAIRALTDVLNPESEDCKRTIVLDPTLVRPDVPEEFSLKTTLEKGGAKDVNNPNVIRKLIRKHLDELTLPKAFRTPVAKTETRFEMLSRWLLEKASKDSVLVFSADGLVDKYIVNKRTYAVFSDVEALRKRMAQILCQNDKATLIVVYNPVEEGQDRVAGILSPPQPATIHAPSPGNDTTTKPRGVRPRGVRLRPVRTERLDGICDYQTHTLYERVLDEDGQPQRGKVLVINCKACGF